MRSTTTSTRSLGDLSSFHLNINASFGLPPAEFKNVSSDFNHDPHSSVFHMDQTKVMDGTFVSILSWYDNEWGFSNRMADTAVAMGKLI